MKKKYLLLCFLAGLMLHAQAQKPRAVLNFDSNWLFNLGDVNNGQAPDADDAKWRHLNLPHDWSIEGEFSKDNPAGTGGGALPGGIGWYRKTFSLPAADKNKLVYIGFDGVYQKSDVWINGHHLGFRPNGYISFRYELTPYLNYGAKKNLIAVKVDNSVQPNSRWYSGSGIYRNVWLVTNGRVAIDHWGTFVTTPKVSSQSAAVNLEVKIRKYAGKISPYSLKTTIYNAAGREVANKVSANISTG